MSKLLDFDGKYYLRGDEVIHVGTGFTQIAKGRDIALQNTAAKMRFNELRNQYELGANNSIILLSDLPDQSTFLNRSGDSMYGDLRMTDNAIILASNGSAIEPSYSFLGDMDTGVFNSAPNAISLVVGSSINPIEVVKVIRTGSGDADSDIFLEGDVYIDEITFDRGLKLDGDYAYFTGHTGLKLPVGTSAQRPITQTGVVRYNSDIDAFDFGLDQSNISDSPTTSPWGILATKKDTSSWFVRAGDSIFGDLQLTNDARILLTDGTAAQPSLTFDDQQSTGIYRVDDTVSLSLRADLQAAPVLSASRIGNGVRDNELLVNADLLVEEISFESLRLHGNYVYVDGTAGLKLPSGNTTERSTITGVTRYNTEEDWFELKQSTQWLVMSGRTDTDTWFNRTGDSISGDIRMTNSAIIRNTNGSIANPSYTFMDDMDTGIARTGGDSIAFVVGSSINSTPAVVIERTGTGNTDKQIIINGDLVVNGTQTVINSVDLIVDDNKITLNKGAIGSVASGIEIENDDTIAATFQYVFATGAWSVDNKRITDVDAPQNQKDAANKKYVDDEITALDEELREVIQDEVDRATSEESRIEGLLEDEIDRATGEESRIEGLLEDEVDRATGEESRIVGLLEDEVDRATDEESRIEGLLQDEISRSTSEDSRIEGLLEDEIARATDEEARIEQDLSDAIDLKVNKSGDTMSGALNMGNNRITNVAAPVNGDDVVTLSFLQSVIFDGGTF